ncbi:hypothetical protein AB0C22_23600 [Micromonospora sp. NPDC048894]|uniref:hypothetical protein n=1 Tax=Micromonospora sp. NPDC048894 TaxID=3155493 RepID=UPI00340C337F
MTNTPQRDFAPPPNLPTTDPPWELQLGFDIEDIYCAYNEWLVFLTQGFPDFELDRKIDAGRWAADRLRELNVAPSLVDQFEEALARLPSQADFRRIMTSGESTSWPEIARTMESLLAAGRIAVDASKVRYYDLGVMLCRVRLCSRMLRVVSSLPEGLTSGLPDLPKIYHKELLRTTTVLATLVASRDPAVPSDPGQHYLEQAFSEFAAYLSTWRNRSVDPDSDFHDQLEKVTQAAGFRPSDIAKQEATWISHPNPVPEEERVPLPAPHSAEDREQLEKHWHEIRRIAKEGDLARSTDLLSLLVHTCRAILGPVHPLTLHIQVSLCAAFGASGKSGLAIVALLDIAATAQHYYSPHHPARYLISADVYTHLRMMYPEMAQEVYDSPLKSLIERDESDLPPCLHSVRRAIRIELGLDDGTTVVT